jgi:hypothetical protein
MLFHRQSLSRHGAADECAAVATLFAAATMAALPAHAELSTEQLAKIAQNPVGNLISVPFQNNTNFDVGPRKGTQDVLNIQPVIPVSVNDEWNVITRTILPIIWQPGMAPGENAITGIGNLQFNAFLSPAKPGEWIWGAGAVVQAPTNSNSRLGNGKWGLGPTFVVLHLASGSPWVYGVLANNIWSLSSGETGGAYNNGLIQPFLNYNMKDGLYLTSSPILTVNWKATGSERWTVPLGGGVGKIFHLGKLPVNTQVSAYYNVARPDFAPSWQLRVQVQFLFPK